MYAAIVYHQGFSNPVQTSGCRWTQVVMESPMQMLMSILLH